MPFEMDGQRLVPARPLPDAARRPPVGLTVASMPSHAFRKPAAKLAGTLLLSGLIASHASATAPPAAGVAEPAATIRTLLKALQQGDEATASGIYRSATDPVAHVWAAMVLERLHFHLDAANADARLCEDDLIDGKPGIALLCGQFRSGDLRLAGRRGEADEVERELVKRFQGHGVDKALADMRAYLAGDEAASPPLTYDSPGGKVSIRGLGSNGTENRDKNEKSLRIIVFRIDHVLIFAWIDGVCGPQSTDSLRPLRGLPLIEAPKSGH